MSLKVFGYKCIGYSMYGVLGIGSPVILGVAPYNGCSFISLHFLVELRGNHVNPFQTYLRGCTALTRLSHFFHSCFTVNGALIYLC